MPTRTRRRFLKDIALGLTGGLTGALAFGQAPARRALGANDRVVLGAIGCGGQGTGLVRSFAAMKDVEMAYTCDPDAGRAGAAAKEVEGAAGRASKAVADLRAVLDDRAIDAVTVATPDHWHAPAAILACAAGKHVYVEKPCAHNIREGRLMVEAARRRGSVVQVGTQSRSAAHVIEAVERLRAGAIGRVLVAKAWNSQLRGNIGRAAPCAPPAGFDYDLWLGPAPHVPFQPNRHHYTWHWWYAFGTGDMGNDGVHDIDIARWGLGADTHPASIAALGGKYFFDDEQEFPDTQYVLFEYPGDGKTGSKRQLIYEQRLWSPYVQEGYENGNAFYGTKGMLLLSKGGGWKLYGERNELKEERPRSELGTPHHRDFLDALRAGRKPRADIETGHLSAALCHLGNIAARVGRQLRFDPEKEAIGGDEEAARLVRRSYREGHWAVPAGAGA